MKWAIIILIACLFSVTPARGLLTQDLNPIWETAETWDSIFQSYEPPPVLQKEPKWYSEISTANPDLEKYIIEITDDEEEYWLTLVASRHPFRSHVGNRLTYLRADYIQSVPENSTVVVLALGCAVTSLKRRR